MGHDFLYGENGDDTLWGDVKDLQISCQGGTNSGSGNATAGAAVTPILGGGSDHLFGGQGNDHLYGDVGTITISLQGGTNLGSPILSNALVAILTSSFTMGNDFLDGGSGNDTLYGDVGTLSITLINGTGPHTTAFINGTVLKFGNDTLIGGSGDDILVGDIADPTQLSGFLNAPVSDFVPEPPLANQLIFGNDTFQFSLGGSNGNDVVKDMNVSAVSTATATVTNVMDTLKFTDVMNVNGGALDYTDVDAQSVFSNSGGHLLISFSGGSVLFENINYAGQTSVTDITPVSNIVVI